METKRAEGAVGIRYGLWGMVLLAAIGMTREAAGQSVQQQAWLEERAVALRSQQRVEQSSLEREAARLHLPLRNVHADGTVLELQRLVDGLPIYFTTLNLDEARAVSADRLWPESQQGFSLTGAGHTIGIWDGGALLADHQELAGRTVKGDFAYSLSSHATHVAATLVGAGVDQAARGMANGARLRTYDFSQDRAEMSLAAAGGLRLSNHSYGQALGWVPNLRGDGKWGWLGDTSVDGTEDYRFGLYDWMASEWDEIAAHAPSYLMVKAAGNDRGQGPAPGEAHWVLDRTLGQWVLSTTVRSRDGGGDGYDTVIDAGNAKNILTVGAVSNAYGAYTTPEDVLMTSFSAWGPSDDGRIKPDVVTDGVAVYSAAASARTAYSSMSGTSSAAPVATGAAALLLEHAAQLFPGTSLRSATLKALLIHTADEAGNAPGPDYRFGWGAVNAWRAAQLMMESAAGDRNAILQEQPLADVPLALRVYADGAEPLRVTIAWIDPPGISPTRSVDPRTPMLVDDLDLRLSDESGTVYQPWILDPATPSAPAALGDNVRDNVEQVVIAAPRPGWYTVHVDHKGQLAGGSQIVSLIVSGATQAPVVPPGLTLEATVFLQGPYVSGTMRTTLRAGNFLPNEQPYASAPWNYAGSESLAPNGIPTAASIVDWVLVQLRSAPSAAGMAATRAALLLQDGRIVDLDGASPVRFDSLAPSSYFVVVRHRNHLAAMTAAAVDFSDGTGAVDFTKGTAYGEDAMAELGNGIFGLFAGDADGDGQVIAPDYQNFWRVENGGAEGYLRADFDLDGQTIALDYQHAWYRNAGRETLVPAN